VFDDVPERLHFPTMSGIRWFVSRSVKITEVSVDGERYENDAGAIARTGNFFAICGFHIEMLTLRSCGSAMLADVSPPPSAARQPLQVLSIDECSLDSAGREALLSCCETLH
jgi:hypothetical protein